MPRFVLSTVGTSSLTNQVTDKDAPEWRGLLRDSANLRTEDLDQGTGEVIEKLADRALTKLIEGDVETIRRISAELNGIYGIYDGQLPQDSSDEHWLVCTDTAQGQTTGKLIQDFLEGQGFKRTSIFTPEGLSTKDTASFTTGTKELIRWLEDNVAWRRERQYRVIFNLVGGFKSLQGYMNTFGAFYADEVIYIFEAQTADLIKIPRLPIQIDTTVIEDHLVKFALMGAGKLYLRHDIPGIPETFLEFIQANGNTYAGLSAWGQLIWNRTKKELLAKELLQFPRLEYESFFSDDFSKQGAGERLGLQETLAKVSHALEEARGSTYPLTRKGLNFEQLKSNADIYTFRITQALRVSCSVANGGLRLRHYGEHQYVYNNP